MPRMIESDITGPLFRPMEIDAWFGRAEDEMARAEAGIALDHVHATLSASLREPTGFYQSRVRIYNMQGDPVVSDGGVIYGPWLEGVGSRNDTTRFKGYHAFLRARQALEANALRVAQAVLFRYLRRFG